MPATRATVVTELIRTAWCDRCQLSTLITYRVLAMNDRGVFHLGTVTTCERCTKEEA